MPLCCCEDSALLAPHIWLDPEKHENRVTMAMATVTKSEILRNFTSKKKKKKKGETRLRTAWMKLYSQLHVLFLGRPSTTNYATLFVKIVAEQISQSRFDSVPIW